MNIKQQIIDITKPVLETVSLKTRTLIETEVQKIHEKTEIKVSGLDLMRKHGGYKH